MGAVNLSYRPDPGRKKLWRAQWYERVGGKLRSREKWFAGPPPPADQSSWAPAEALTFKATHESEGEKFQDLAMSSTDRARWWRVRSDCEAAGVTVEAAIAAGLAALKQAAPHTEELDTALELWVLDAKARKLRPSSIDSVQRFVRAFITRRDPVKVDGITGRDLLLWVGARYTEQTSRDDVLARLLTFFRWCAAPPRGWTSLAKFAEVRWTHKVKGEKKRIGFYSAAEATALIEATPDGYKAAIATGFFAGLRPFEMNRVRLAWPNEGEFYGLDTERGEWHIAAEWAKTRAYRRLYALPDNWWYWWLKYSPKIGTRDRKSRKHAGKLVPTNYRNFRRAMSGALARAGLRMKKDGIRHSFGTHGYHRSSDGQSRGVEWCIALMGHVGGFRVFEQSYNGKVSTAEAEAYFLIYPEGAACQWDPPAARTPAHRARIIVASPDWGRAGETAPSAPGR